MDIIEITKEEFQQKLDELSKENWKVKGILKAKHFDNLTSRMQNMILDLLGLKKITKIVSNK